MSRTNWKKFDSSSLWIVCEFNQHLCKIPPRCPLGGMYSSIMFYCKELLQIRAVMLSFFWIYCKEFLGVFGLKVEETGWTKGPTNSQCPATSGWTMVTHFRCGLLLELVVFLHYLVSTLTTGKVMPCCKVERSLELEPIYAFPVCCIQGSLLQ